MEKKAWSMKGWEFLYWVRDNVRTIKEIAKMGAPLMFGVAFFSDKPALVFVLTGLGKLALDTVEYYVKPRTK